MITSEQIKALRNAGAGDNSRVEALLLDWEAELHLKALSKQGAIELTLWDQRKTRSVKVAAVKISDTFAVHKAVWGRKGQTVTHIRTGLSALTGSTREVRAFVHEYTNHPDMAAMDKAWADFDGSNSGVIHNNPNAGKLIELCRKQR